VRVCLGLYAGKGFTNPLKGRTAGRYQLIEVTDNATLRRNRAKVLASVLNAVCPHPVRFKQVWHLARNGKTLYAWKAFAPEGFVAMGMMATLKDEPPDVKTMRCVPEAWVVASKKPPFKVWDDTGAGGGKPGSIWTINSMDMVAIVAGHEPPQESFYDLNSTRFFIDSDKLPKNLFDEK
jgi:hypothetical protein